MINPIITKKSINRIYHTPSENLYSSRFYQDFCTAFSIRLNKNDSNKSFFFFEPSECIASKLLCANNHYDLGHKVEQTIENAMFSLMAYGRAYIYLQPHYIHQASSSNTEGSTQRIISALDIGEIKGAIKKKIGNKCIFYSLGFNGKVITRELLNDGLIILNIKELGYEKKYFPHLLKKLKKCDVTSSTMMIFENFKEYDFNAHLEKKRLQFLKATKSIGWTFGNDSLSDSYILYRQILQNKFRIKALEFIISKINIGLSNCLHNKAVGKLTANINKLDYDDIWRKYSKGEITVTELTNILYTSH